ncbi:MAG: hypothetical protein ACXQS4_02475 [Methermicoccaceae archaeon]
MTTTDEYIEQKALRLVSEARRHAKAGEMDLAEQRYDEAIAICPVIPCPTLPLLIEYGRFLVGVGKNNKAIEIVERATGWVQALERFKREFGDDKK